MYRQGSLDHCETEEKLKLYISKGSSREETIEEAEDLFSNVIHQTKKNKLPHLTSCMETYLSSCFIYLRLVKYFR